MIRQDLHHMIKVHGRRVYALGVVMVILGILAIAVPFVAGLAIQLFLGILLVAAGIAWLIFAFHARSWGSGIREGIVGLLTIIAGGLVMDRPLVSLALMTLVLGAWFFGTGIFRIILAFHLKPLPSWKWILFNGVVSLLLGGMVLFHWPVSGLWLVGTLVGIDLIFEGFGLIRLASLERHLAAAAASV